MSNIANSLRAVLELIASLQVRKTECEAAFEVILEQRTTHTKCRPAISDGLKTHGKALYAALDAGDIDTAEREGNEYMKWTMEEKKYDRMFQSFTQNMEEQSKNLDKIGEELNQLFTDLAIITSHGDSNSNNYEGVREWRN